MRNLKTPDMQVFKERLKQLRHAKGFDTGLEAATALGLAQTTYGKYESGYRFPRLDGLIDLATFFDVCPLWLIGSTDDPLNQEVSKKLASDAMDPNRESKIGDFSGKFVADNGHVYAAIFRLIE